MDDQICCVSLWHIFNIITFRSSASGNSTSPVQSSGKLSQVCFFLRCILYFCILSGILLSTSNICTTSNRAPTGPRQIETKDQPIGSKNWQLKSLNCREKNIDFFLTNLHHGGCPQFCWVFNPPFIHFYWPLQSQQLTFWWFSGKGEDLTVLVLKRPDFVGSTHIPLPFDVGFAWFCWNSEASSLYAVFLSTICLSCVSFLLIWNVWLSLVFLWHDLFAFGGVVLFLGRTCGFVFVLWLTRVCVFFCFLFAVWFAGFWRFFVVCGWHWNLILTSKGNGQASYRAWGQHSNLNSQHTFHTISIYSLMRKREPQIKVNKHCPLFCPRIILQTYVS